METQLSSVFCCFDKATNSSLSFYFQSYFCLCNSVLRLLCTLTDVFISSFLLLNHHLLPSPPPHAIPSPLLFLSSLTLHPHHCIPNTSPPQQRTTSLLRRSNGKSTAVETLWGWRGCQAAIVVPWNTAVVVYSALPDGTCLIFPRPSLATLWDGSMVLTVIPSSRLGEISTDEFV